MAGKDPISVGDHKDVDSATVTLAEYIANAAYSDLPDSAVVAAKRAVLDQIGLILLGSTLPWSTPAVTVLSSFGGAPESAILGTVKRAPAVHAAMINSGFGHACEMDDSGYTGGCHPGSLTVPPALALAERDGLSGKDVLLAIVVGYEVLSRMGRVMTEALLAKGFHHQSVIGPFGVAAVAGRLLRFDPETMVNALAIAGSHSGGVAEYDQQGGEVKRYHSSIAVQGGMMAALLAQAGLTGPYSILEGTKGVPRLFAGVSDVYDIVAGLDDVSGLAVERTTFKPYPATGTLHTSIYALSELMREHSFGPDDVESIDVSMSPLAKSHGGSIIEPQDVIGAQFSLAFSLALVLMFRRCVLADYMNADLWHDPDVKKIGSKVHIHTSEEFTGPLLTGARLRVSLIDGRVLDREELHRKGSPVNPLSSDEMTQKFRGSAGAVLDDRQMDRVISLIDHLDELDDVSQLVAALVPDDESVMA
jgi:2-methylcitrate dehydratase PrpD